MNTYHSSIAMLGILLLSASYASCFTPKERALAEQSLFADENPLTIDIICKKLKTQKKLLLTLDGLDALPEAPQLKLNLDILRDQAKQIARLRKEVQKNPHAFAQAAPFKQRLEQSEIEFIADYPQTRKTQFDLYTKAKSLVNAGRLRAQEAKRNDQD